MGREALTYISILVFLMGRAETDQSREVGGVGHHQLSQFAALSTIFDALDLLVYVSDFQTYELLFLNSKCEKTFGTEWRQKRCYEVLQQGQTKPCSFCTNPRLVKDGVPQPPHTWEFRNTLTRRWYLCIDQAIPWVDGRLVRMEAAVDITERKESERFREQYVGLVAHDLANPLNALMLLGKTLERPLRAPGLESQLETLAHMMGNARRMETMIRDLYESVRLEAAARDLRRESLDLVGLAEDLMRLLPPQDQDRVRLQASGRPFTVQGDGPLLQRVMQNLVANALRHSPPGALVDLAITHVGPDIQVSVSNQGPVIPEEFVGHLFDRGFRVPGTKSQGLGLGLYIARLIIEGHGGRIEAQPGLTQGACFRFTVPAV